MTDTHLRFAGLSDILAIQAFINRHWQKGHILTRNSQLLRWQHGSTNDQLNFVLCERKGELVGILGFIEPTRFASDLPDKTLSLSTWVVRSGKDSTGVGVALVRFLLRHRSPFVASTIGVSIEAQRILRMIGFTTGEMNHHAIFNPQISNSLIVSGLHKRSYAPPTSPNSSVNFGLVSEQRHYVREILNDHNHSFWPAKSMTYFQHRFVQHPWYQYVSITHMKSERPRAIMICRPIEVLGTRILRCVDAIGFLCESELVTNVQRVLIEHNFDYVDFVHHMSDTDSLDSCGFIDVRGSGPPKLPGYFEPFKNEPRTLRFAYKTSQDMGRRPHLFLADSDQDRPNE